MPQRFNPLHQHLSFALPDRLTGVESWHQHLPFAAAIVAVLRPATLVELGTHRGDSYCGFCQAVTSLGLPTRCYAVDTWQGDEHSGRYGEEVLQELRAYHDPRYGGFSTLLRSTFDEARAQFADGSIDLLHIDGLHTEEAVRHDFESWLPKLSKRAVVLFHDTNVHEADFGVWKFWGRVSATYPGFEFPHGHGLGVLAVGPEVPEALLELCTASGEERGEVARFYQALGERISGTHRLNIERVDAERRVQQATALAAAREQALTDTEQLLHQVRTELLALRRQQEELHAQLAVRGEEVAKLRKLTDERQQEVSALKQALAEKEQRLARLDALAAGRQTQLEQLRGTRSWKLTAPLRRVGELATAVGSIKDGGPGRGLKAARRRARQLQLLRGSGLFDTAWYLDQYPDVAGAGVDPLLHYLEKGASEDRDPSRWFDTSWYLSRYPDVVETGVHPLVHYLEHGARELRDPHPSFSAMRYVASHPEARENPLLHLLRTGARAEGHGPAGRTPDAQQVKAVREALATGALNRAWYGGEQVRPLAPAPSHQALPDPGLVDLVDAADTEAIVRLITPSPELGQDLPHGGAPSVLARSLAPLAECEAFLAEVHPIQVPEHDDGDPSFSLVTPFYKHHSHFAACARSVLALLEKSPGVAFEWIILNDDPSFSAQELEDAIPAALRGSTRILSDGENRGIVRRLNQAVGEARNEWILFLDCDDLIDASAIAVLHHYISRFPRCRYISSSVVDIGEDGGVLRYRRRVDGPSRLLSQGMTAGHLKAIRRDAFTRFGLFDEAFQGCQDYEFALRMAFEEPLLYIPEYLYSYRWHGGSQSVEQARRQTATADAIVRHCATRYLERSAPVLPAAQATADDALPGRGVAIIRTQGNRSELLEDALHSLQVQQLPITALVVVHGDQGAFARVQAATANLPGTVEVLHAPDTRRLRGYPLNLALEHLYASAGTGFVFFLDDDDIVYPLFAQKMHEALTLSGADLVHAASNKRVSFEKSQQAFAPLPAPCLLVENFIPINGYAMRFAALKARRLLFSEELEYLEDWDFLVRALGSGMRFFPLADTLSEFRVIGDGNRATKKRPALWQECEQHVRANIRSLRATLRRPDLLRQVLTFPPELLSPVDLDHVLAARARIDELWPADGSAPAATSAASTHA